MMLLRKNGRTILRIGAGSSVKTVSPPLMMWATLRIAASDADSFSRQSSRNFWTSPRVFGTSAGSIGWNWAAIAIWDQYSFSSSRESFPGPNFS
jgi:hypothetical protein